MNTASRSLQSQLFVQNSFTLISCVILLYDHVITLDSEYRRIWQRPRRKASVMFLISRYVALLTVPATIFSSFPTASAEEACQAFTLYRQIVIGVLQIIVTVNQFLRVYALYGRNRCVAAVVLIAAAVFVSLGIWSIMGQKSGTVASGCHAALDDNTAKRLAAAWEALFAYDLLIVLLTLVKAFKERSQLAAAGRSSLVGIIYRDGVLYFAVMACAQCANVLTFYTLSPVLKGILSTLASSISVTMMSRCILNLHDRDAQLHGITEWGLDGTVVAGGELSFAGANSATAADEEGTELTLLSRPEGLTGESEFCSNEAHGTVV